MSDRYGVAHQTASACAWLFGGGQDSVPGLAAQTDASTSAAVPPVFFAIKVSSFAVEASDVLKGVAGAKGFAELPVGISARDFLLWQSSSPADGSLRTVEELRRLIKVADALCDTRMELWALELAKLASNTNWDCPSKSAEMQETLLKLPANARMAVLQRVLSSSRHSSPAKATEVTAFPQALHPFLVCAMIDPSGTLAVPDPSSRDHTTVMATLPQLHSNLVGCPPLRCLVMPESGLQPGACHPLSEALPHQTCLSHLKVAIPADHKASPVLHAFLSHLQACKSLKKISISCETSSISTSMQLLDDLTARSQGVQHLSSLSFQKIPCLTPDRASHLSPLLLHKKVARAIQRTATLSHLTQLHIGLSGVHCAPPWPDAFPTLQDLSVDCCIPDSLVPLSSEQLANIEFTHCQRRGRATHMPSLTRLKFSLSSPPNLDQAAFHVGMFLSLAFRERWLPIGSADLLEGKRLGDLCPRLLSLQLSLSDLVRLGPGSSNASEVERLTLWPQVSGAISAAPTLQSLQLDSQEFASAAPAITEALKQLTRLTNLDIKSMYTYSLPREGVQVAISNDFAESLPTSLKQLRLGHHDGGDASFTRALLARLALATNLTSLTLQCGNESSLGCAWAVMRGAAYGDSLPQVKSLRHVHLETCVIQDPQQLWNGLAGLPKLEALHLNEVGLMQEGSDDLGSLWFEPLVEVCKNRDRALGFARSVAAMRCLELLDISVRLHTPRPVRSGLKSHQGFSIASLISLSDALCVSRTPSARPLRLMHSKIREDVQPEDLLLVQEDLHSVNISLVCEE